MVEGIVNTLNASARAKAKDVEKVVFPMTLHLERVIGSLYSSSAAVGCQVISNYGKGARTGDVFEAAFAEAGVKWALAGHSEQRKYHSCTDDQVANQTTRALAGGLKVCACVGENLTERKAGRALDVVVKQTRPVLAAVAKSGKSIPDSLVLAYEPVWAIGTGQTATPELAQEMHSKIRSWIQSEYGASVANAIRIIYGGSVKPKNCDALFKMSDIDGFLLGGASIKNNGKDFVYINSVVQGQIQARASL